MALVCWHLYTCTLPLPNFEAYYKYKQLNKLIIDDTSYFSNQLFGLCQFGHILYTFILVTDSMLADLLLVAAGHLSMVTVLVPEHNGDNCKSEELTKKEKEISCSASVTFSTVPAT